jgi:flagellar basal-body rod protein FlgC
MNFLNDFDISGYGLSAQRFRINTISSNIANANTTRTDEGGPYKRKDVVFKAINFDEQLNSEIEKNGNLLNYANPLEDSEANFKPRPAIMGVVVDKVVRDDSDFKMKFDPSHPDANEKGYVAYPNINPVIEMANLVEATRAYQANISAFQSAKTLANSAIEIIRG